MKRRIDIEEHILEFLYKWHRAIRIGDMIKELKKEGLDIPHSSINSVIQRLEDDELVQWEKYSTVSLTEKGLKKVAHKLRHSHLLVMFLMKTLNLPHEIALKESYSLSNAISCDLIERINKELEFPSKCYCNEFIPQIDNCMVKSYD
ncbi:MAG: metal-dependent transcriptional regulator [Candidatus Thorarchaeota archaeon]